MAALQSSLHTASSWCDMLFKFVYCPSATPCVENVKGATFRIKFYRMVHSGVCSIHRNDDQSHGYKVTSIQPISMHFPKPQSCIIAALDIQSPMQQRTSTQHNAINKWQTRDTTTNIKSTQNDHQMRRDRILRFKKMGRMPIFRWQTYLI